MTLCKIARLTPYNDANEPPLHVLDPHPPVPCQQLRYGLSRSGPLQEALDICMKELDGPSLSRLMPSLLLQLRSGVGLNTRCCAANLVLVLSTRFRPELKVHLPALLRVLAAGALTERSSTAQRFFLSALAGVAKLAPGGEEVRRAILRLLREYRRVADLATHRSQRLPVVLALRQLCTAAGEGLEEAAWAAVLPLAYVGRFEEEEGGEGEVRKAWEEIWMEGCAALGKGGGNTTKALGDELCTEVERELRSSSWSGRRAALKALASLSEGLGRGGLRLHARRLVGELLDLLPGRLWEGKDEVLRALVKVVVACPGLLREGGGEEGWLFWEEGGGGAGRGYFPPGLLRVAEEGEEGGRKEEGGDDVWEGLAVGVTPAAEASEAAEGRDEEAFGRLVREDAEDQAINKEGKASLVQGAALSEIAASGCLASLSPRGEDLAAPAATGQDPTDDGLHSLSYRGLIRVLTDQCRRPHRDYRRAAVQAIMELASAFPSLDVLESVRETLVLMAGGLEASVGVESCNYNKETVAGRAGSEVDHVLRAWAVEALGACFPPSPPMLVQGDQATSCPAYLTQKESLPWLLPMLLSRSSFSVWSLRRAVHKALKRVMERVYVRPDANSASFPKDSGSCNQVQPSADLAPLPSLLTGSVVDRVISAAIQGVGDAKYHQVREVAIDVLLALIKRPEMEVHVSLMPHSDRIMSALEKVVHDQNPEVVRLAMEARALLHRVGG